MPKLESAIHYSIQSCGIDWMLLFITGICIAILGMIGAGLGHQLFPYTISFLYITAGLMAGLGFGFMYLPAMDIVALFFDR